MKKIILACCVFMASIQLVDAQDDKLYKGAELYTQGDNHYLYGKVEVRMKAAKGSGIISSFYAFTDTAKDGSEIWEEVDLEIFGKNNATTFQSNIVTDTPGAPNVEEVFDTGVSLEGAYHTYTIEWRPDSVAWKVDGVLVRVIKGGKSLELTDPLSLHFNIWSSNSESWVGPFDTKILPVHLFVNWIKYYGWNGTEFTETPIWTDDFNVFDSTRWGMANWTFDVSNVDFDPANANVVDGYLVLSLTDAINTGYKGTPPTDSEIVLPASTEVDVVEETSSSTPTTAVSTSSTKATASKATTAGTPTSSDNVFLNDSQSLLSFSRPVIAKSLMIVNRFGVNIKKIKDYRSGQSLDVSFLTSGTYYIVVDKKSKYKFVIE